GLRGGHRQVQKCGEGGRCRQDLSRARLTERAWLTYREGGITNDIKAETDRLLVARDSTLRHAASAGVQRAPTCDPSLLCENRELSPAHTQRSRPGASSATLALPIAETG